MEDKYNDERRMLIIGFLVMLVSVALVPFIGGKSIVLWSVILFASRVGAGIVEVSTETYFFKHVKSTNTGYISLFRMTRALPFLIVPAIATLAIKLIGIEYSWLILSLVMLFGIRYTKKLS